MDLAMWGLSDVMPQVSYIGRIGIQPIDDDLGVFFNCNFGEVPLM
jgi:hypothetical protein